MKIISAIVIFSTSILPELVSAQPLPCAADVFSDTYSECDLGGSIGEGSGFTGPNIQMDKVDAGNRVLDGGPALLPNGAVWLRLEGTLANGGLAASSCTGSLISSEWVLTAAHCLFLSNGKGQPVSPVKRGRVYLDTLVEGRGISRKIAAAFHHPDYGFSEHFFRNDVALVKLGRPARGVDLMPLMKRSDQSMRDRPAGSTVTFYGFGQIGPYHDSDILMVGTVNTVRNLPHWDTFFFTGTAGKTGATSTLCPGDSGGPTTRSDGFGLPEYQVGINSVIRNVDEGEVYCGRPGNLSGIVDLSLFLDFIEERSGVSIRD